MGRYKINEIDSNLFYMIPKELFKNEKYRSLNSDAKLLYSILKDRMELSRTNNWINDTGEIYLIYTRDNLKELMGVSKPTLLKAFKQLKNTNLIEEERRGLGKPNLIYICHLEVESIEKCKKSNFFTSGNKEILPQKVKNFYPNDTDINNTEFIDTQSVSHNKIEKKVEVKTDKNGQTDNIDTKLNSIIEKAEINLYKGPAKELLEITIKKLLELKELKVKNTVIKRQQIHQQLLKLDINTCDYALSKFRQVQQDRVIKNKSNYFMVLLYTAIEEVAANGIY